MTPTRIRVSVDRMSLALEFADRPGVSYDAEFLRVHSPSAEVRGHGNAERQIVGGKRQVKIMLVEAVGSYAIRIGFDDGHDTGIYSWTLLESFARDHERLWGDYLTALATRGLTRD
ncbi:gamma-butyrobetaine hydroxylase family protein [Govanella unica]|uniref:DUF971 domain-containing protein n=1 Tax=Govanella unica TaxID=2975056 RepID=A0A9X3Z5R8_9PROT|nr:DUF971 domain-containing protein [Govania unica]